jgi:3-oxoadipate enol-lactonase
MAESKVSPTLKMWFSPEFHQREPESLSIYRTMLARTHTAGYLASCAALRDADFSATAASIGVPTLFVGGDHDGSTPVALVESSARLVPGSRFEMIVGVAHIPCVEKPAKFAQLLADFA